MQAMARKRPVWLSTLAVVAIVFGLLTIISGGRTLFDAETQRLAGNYVGFVLWFNFLAGFVYIIAGIGLWLQQRWSVWLAILIAAATLLIFVVFGLQILRGGSYEMRTVAAMALRALTWLAIAAAGYTQLLRLPEAHGNV
jgi:hypothetical protein